MDEYLFYKFLQDNKDHMYEDEDLIHKFKKFMKVRRDAWGDDYTWEVSKKKHHPMYPYMQYPLRHEKSYQNNIADEDMYRMMRYMKGAMRDSSNYSDEYAYQHFDMQHAKSIVNDMYHMENGRKHSGEKFDMEKAKEVCEKYKHTLSTSPTPCDVYVAINAQYHDYAELFKSWFGTNIDNKIIESAMVFWFKDMDYTGENKILDYINIM